MPDRRNHRGPHPEDARLFHAETLPTLRHAVSDMSWLLSHGYADKSSLKLVGDRYGLRQRQRLAIMRSSCSDGQFENRNLKKISPNEMDEKPIVVDGYNLLITVEAALSDAVLFVGRDRSVRDLSGIHGTYRKVSETQEAISTIAKVTRELNIPTVTWFLDSPVSNSVKLKEMILSIAKVEMTNWTVELLTNPDKVLIESSEIIVSSDSVVLDRCQRWLNLSRLTVDSIGAKQDINLFDLHSP